MTKNEIDQIADAVVERLTARAALSALNAFSFTEQHRNMYVVGHPLNPVPYPPHAPYSFLSSTTCVGDAQLHN